MPTNPFERIEEKISHIYEQYWIASASVVLVTWPITLIFFWDWISAATAHRSLARNLATFVCGIFAFFLYGLRNGEPLLYGLAEISTGLMVCWLGLGQAAEQRLPATLALVGGIYVIIRGLDNCSHQKVTRRR
jgi:hypothetical protein